jgi:Ca2+-binding RTX toxin-like protein
MVAKPSRSAMTFRQQLGNGNNTVTLGNGNDNVQVGNGNNVVVEGNGNDNIKAGNGDNLIVAGLGRHTVQAGNGSNILIDGSVQLTQSGDSLRQVLNDWTQYGALAANVASIRARLKVTYNTSYANTLDAGSSLDWFWEIYGKDSTNRKATDLLN